MTDDALVSAVLRRFVLDDMNWSELRADWMRPEIALDGYVEVSAEEMAALQRLVAKKED